MLGFAPIADLAIAKLPGEAGSTTMVASAGAYTVTGQAATLTRQLVTTASQGAYTYTGQAATLTKQYLVSAEAGSYTYTGFDATTAKTGNTLLADVGSYAVTGQAATLNGPIQLTAAQGAYTVTGFTATTQKTINSALDAGSYTTTGNDVTFLYRSNREDLDLSVAITIPGAVTLSCSVPGSATVASN